MSNPACSIEATGAVFTMFTNSKSGESLGTNLHGENLLEDEESPSHAGTAISKSSIDQKDEDQQETSPLLSTIDGYGGTSSGNCGEAKTDKFSKFEYGSVEQSETSSLDCSDNEQRDNDINKYNANVQKINRGTMNALKDGGMLLTKEENRSLSSILLTVILTCTFSMAFLASAGVNVPATPGTNGVKPIETKVNYFPFPDGEKFVAKRGLSSALETSKYVPFQTIDRKDYNVPASEVVFPELFHSTLQVQKNASYTGKMHGAMPLLNVPFPTGAFWSNLAIRATPVEGFSYPSMAYPYGFQWNPSMMQYSYPPLRRLEDNISIRDIFNPDLKLGTEETISKRNIVRWDPLSVTTRFYGNQVNADAELHNATPDPKTSYWENYLVHGSPYITVRYNKMTPVINPLTSFKNVACLRDASGNYKNDASDMHNGDSTHSKHFGVCSKTQVS